MATWIFGYGSLIFRPDFPFVSRQRAFVHDFERRFFQASTDHRGTPEQPGRVVTLVPSLGARCGGMAYALADHEASQVLTHLDYRERGGYLRAPVRISIDDENSREIGAITWIAWPDNPNFAGAASLDDIAHIVRISSGPSGRNRDYVARLDSALRELGIDDPHVSALMASVDSASL